MKVLIRDLIFFILLCIPAIMVYCEICPQYHEWCIRWLFFGSIAGLVDVIKRIIRYRREKESL